MRAINIISLVLVGAILVILITILMYLNRKEKERLRIEIERLSLYKKSIDEIGTDKKNIEDINKLVRGFFKNFYNLDYNLTYLELADKFEQKNEREISNFCTLMSNTLYSGKEINKENLKKLKYNFLKILETT